MIDVDPSDEPADPSDEPADLIPGPRTDAEHLACVHCGQRSNEATCELERARAHVIECAKKLDTNVTPIGITTVVTLDHALQRLARAEASK